MPFDQAKEEIEKGLSAVQWALEGAETAPFFRFPQLKHPPDVVKYLGERNIAMFSTDFNSFDFKMRKPEQVIKSVMDKLEKNGKGIILMHDFQHATAEALPELLKQMKEKGYKVVHMKPKFLVKSLPQYDAMILAGTEASDGERPADFLDRQDHRGITADFTSASSAAATRSLPRRDRARHREEVRRDNRR